MSVGHTATPWECDINCDEPMVYIHDDNHRFSLRLEMNDSSMPRYAVKKKEMRAELEANAHFIVSACNSHDDLVESVQRLIGALGVMITDRDNENDVMFARAALAKAGIQS